ncbi:hypothetical protein DV495_004322 [Geotrichum candidum]|nr:hypothetical protein DV454_003843 [Geotrichum candidum]KAI9212610.1 hypothetical protein DS838_002524 [Geotrichum bryndzae]KAF5115814.1 hypothetical protein DV452_002858 [Geotrichum candidum]KAF5121491.1 hypothetical protein DV495_004322 [Geotrichum candidum]KAF7501636.1 hypothetical protein DV113_000367 [Geotrichum candidum]
MSDPLVALRTTIASNLTPELLSKDGEVLPDADLSKAASLRLPANGDREAQTFPLTELTKYESKIPNKMQLDLRVVYNCWLTRDLNVTDYIQISDERGIFNLKFVERADLLGWLKGENEESENILNDKAGKADGSGDGNAANQATDESKPTKKTVSFDDSSSAELKLIYEHERTLLNITNVKQFLENAVFENVMKSSSSSNVQMIARKSPRLGYYKFVVVDNTERLTRPEYWDRVVAVFVTGQAWQFKQYLWSDPNQLFQKVAGFCLTFNGDPVPPQVKQWNVDVVGIDRNQRFRDREVSEMIWTKIERWMIAKGWPVRKR